MENRFRNPIFDGADPFLLHHKGKYYIYCTTENGEPLSSPNAFHTSMGSSDGFQVYESDDLKTWNNRGYCLKKGDVIGEKWFWAPEVTYYNNQFYMIYAAEEHIAIAVADTPTGPFRQKEKQWLRETKAIDGHIFIDDDGQAYLYYVRLGGGNRIFAAKLSEDLLRITEEYEPCLIEAKEPWETIDCNVAEGPFVLKQEGMYYLTYSCNHTRCKDYAMGYAISESPLGPFRKYPKNPILHKSSGVCGVGHHSFCKANDGDLLICAYHCHNRNPENFKPRQVCLNTAQFIKKENGEVVLTVHGPTGE